MFCGDEKCEIWVHIYNICTSGAHRSRSVGSDMPVTYHVLIEQLHFTDVNKARTPSMFSHDILVMAV